MESDVVVTRMVRISDLKKIAQDEIPRGPLRDDILSQPDEVSPEDFLASARVWLRLARAR
jgi:hypothetical protein